MSEPNLKPLSRRARQVAMAEAQGFTSKQIMELFLVAKSTLHEWRHRDDYKALLEHYKTGQKALMIVSVDQKRKDWLDIGDDVIKQITEALAATDADGRPLWPVRLKAAELWANNPLLKTLLELANKEAGVDPADNKPEFTGAVTLRIYRDEGGKAHVTYGPDDVEEVVDEPRAEDQDTERPALEAGGDA